jgi:hypothetical protein
VSWNIGLPRDSNFKKVGEPPTITKLIRFGLTRSRKKRRIMEILFFVPPEIIRHCRSLIMIRVRGMFWEVLELNYLQIRSFFIESKLTTDLWID